MTYPFYSLLRFYHRFENRACYYSKSIFFNSSLSNRHHPFHPSKGQGIPLHQEFQGYPKDLNLQVVHESSRIPFPVPVSMSELLSRRTPTLTQVFPTPSRDPHRRQGSDRKPGQL